MQPLVVMYKFRSVSGHMIGAQVAGKPTPAAVLAFSQVYVDLAGGWGTSWVGTRTPLRTWGSQTLRTQCLRRSPLEAEGSLCLVDSLGAAPLYPKQGKTELSWTVLSVGHLGITLCFSSQWTWFVITFPRSWLNLWQGLGLCVTLAPGDEEKLTLEFLWPVKKSAQVSIMESHGQREWRLLLGSSILCMV